MKTLCFGFGILLAATLAWADEPRELFNGKDLEGWVVEGPQIDRQKNPLWIVKDGNILCSGKGYGFLRYDKQEFDDFILHVEYRFAPPVDGKQFGNSGLGIRTVPFNPKESSLTRPSYASYEVQLLDDAGKAPNAHGTASLYRYVGPTTNRVKAAPEWNEIDIECVGPRIKIRVNGEQVLDADQTKFDDIKGKPAKAPAPKDKPLRGYLCLQSHSGQVEFRKVQVRELKK